MDNDAATYFDVAAGKFDAFYQEGSKTWFGRLIDARLRTSMQERFDRTFQVLSPLKDKTVLDIGCGSGRYSVTCAELGAKLVTGVDFAPSMLEIARQIAEKAGLQQRTEFIQVDYLDYEVPERIDAAMVMGVFDYVPDPAGFLRKIAADVQGTVVASFPVRNDFWALQRKIRYRVFKRCPLYFYTPARLQEIFSQAGISDYHIEKCHRDYVVDLRTP